jgi:hypothetical protein
VNRVSAVAALGARGATRPISALVTSQRGLGTEKGGPELQKRGPSLEKGGLDGTETPPSRNQTPFSRNQTPLLNFETPHFEDRTPLSQLETALLKRQTDFSGTPGRACWRRAKAARRHRPNRSRVDSAETELRHLKQSHRL